jgi:two-component sensor histidine kinase/PAS domain-containing protein
MKKEELERENRELKRSLGLYRILFDAGREAVFILEGATVRDCNSQTLVLFGCGRDDITGRRINRFIPDLQDDGSVSVDLIKAYCSALRKEGHVSFEMLHRRLDSTPFLAVVSLNLLRQAADDGSDLVVAQLRDISESRKIERDLRLKSAQFEAIIESIPFDLWISDMQNRNFLQNRASKELWGDTHGRHYSTIALTGEILKKWRESNEKAMSGKIVEMEIEYPIGGSPHYYRNIVAPIFDEESIIGIVGINIDITDYRQAVQKVQKALNEREILIKEIHHRVKNNLQIISSIINLKCGAIPDEAREEWALFHDIENRIASMALIHEQLYNSDSFTDIGMRLYLSRLIETLQYSYSTVAAGVTVELDCGEISLDIDKAIPLGIILTELITNCFKHAFDTGGGALSISFRETENSYLLTLTDDGPGSPGDPQLKKSSGLGLTLIKHLTDQLKGKVQFDGSRGFVTRLEFPFT